MKTSLICAAPAALLLLAGCEKAEAPAPADITTTTEVPVETAPAVETGDSATAPHRFASWAGKWTGPEGLHVTITPTEPGKYKLDMQSDLDTRGSYDGQDSEHGIQFRRGGEQLSLRRGSGDESGLKYLMGKQECLIVKTGEGYCRD
jgi:hypothetical protein